jgi:hypothetical protein
LCSFFNNPRNYENISNNRKIDTKNNNTILLKRGKHEKELAGENG